jgi:hypothetical protein
MEDIEEGIEPPCTALTHLILNTLRPAFLVHLSLCPGDVGCRQPLSRTLIIFLGATSVSISTATYIVVGDQCQCQHQPAVWLCGSN